MQKLVKSQLLWHSVPLSSTSVCFPKHKEPRWLFLGSGDVQRKTTVLLLSCFARPVCFLGSRECVHVFCLELRALLWRVVWDPRLLKHGPAGWGLECHLRLPGQLEQSAAISHPTWAHLLLLCSAAQPRVVLAPESDIDCCFIWFLFPARRAWAEIRGESLLMFFWGFLELGEPRLPAILGFLANYRLSCSPLLQFLSSEARFHQKCFLWIFF